MTEQKPPLSGPDLGAGVPIATIGRDSTLLGHTQGEPVRLPLEGATEPRVH